MPLLKQTLLVLVATAMAQEWNYDQCDSQKGPSNWPSFCKNQANGGTPIDLCNAKGFPTSAPTITAKGYDTARELSLINDGKTVQINILNDNPRLTAGGLSGMVGRGTNTSTHEWVMAQMHLHWGRTGRTDEGSEHYLQGKRYPLEGHYVHYNAQFDNLTHAVFSGKPESLLVVGVFFEQKSTDTTLMASIAQQLDVTASTTAKKMSGTHKLDELFSTSGAFYSYGGSLTTPTCLEQVTWIVMRDVKPITLDTLNKIKSAQKSGSELVSKYGNYRPIQPLGNRNLYFSAGATAQCDSVRSDPVFQCTAPPAPTPPTTNPSNTQPTNSGSLASPSILCLLLAFCATYLNAH